MYNAEDVQFTNSKMKLTETPEVRRVRSRDDGAVILVDDRTFDPALHMEEQEYQDGLRPTPPPPTE